MKVKQGVLNSIPESSESNKDADADVKIPLTGSDELKELKAKICKERCVSKFQIVWSLINFIIVAGDVFVIIYLSYLHFQHSSDLIAWLMLLPILLNFIGIFTFLSDDEERKEMESLGCQKRTWIKNLMFLPVFGPAFSALRLFIYTLEEPSAERTERLESMLTRMKQYESFFRAAPEAFIQITFRVSTWTAGQEYHAEDYWTNVCIVLCMFTLAESNMYAPVIPYYKMFHRKRGVDVWKINKIPIKWRVGLFFFSYSSVASRLAADALLKASACFLFPQESFGEVIIITFLFQFLLRAGLYVIFNSLASKKRSMRVANEGVYGAFTYSWRSLFMSFDFASNQKWIFFWFYIESIIMIGISYGIVLGVGVDLSSKTLYHGYAIAALILIMIAICLKFTLRYRWKKRVASKMEKNGKIIPK